MNLNTDKVSMIPYVLENQLKVLDELVRALLRFDLLVGIGGRCTLEHAVSGVSGSNYPAE